MAMLYLLVFASVLFLGLFALAKKSQDDDDADFLDDQERMNEQARLDEDQSIADHCGA